MYRRRQWRKHNQRSGSVTPFFMGVFRQHRSPKHENEPATTSEIYDLHGPYGTQHPYPQTGQRSGKRGQPIILSRSSPEPIAVVSTTASGSSSVNRSGASDSDNNNPTIQLRSEMENLRREVDEMRARNLYEPPPQYA